MSTEKLRKAVESTDSEFEVMLEGLSPLARAEYIELTSFPMDRQHWQTIRQALRDQEAENAAQATELRTLRGEYAKEFKRAEKAEALLRECVENREGLAYETDLLARITAHLGGEQ